MEGVANHCRNSCFVFPEQRINMLSVQAGVMQMTLSKRENQGLFSPHFLSERLSDSQEWKQLDNTTVETAFEEIKSIYHDRMPQLENKNESQTEKDFIRPVLRKLGHVFEVEEKATNARRFPDFAFFTDDAAKDNAMDRKEKDGDFYETAIGVADAKRWGLKLDVSADSDQDTYGNPNYQIYDYLLKTDTTWGILTNGKQWRLYHQQKSRSLNVYLTFELASIIEDDDFETFKEFYFFFAQRSFIPDATGECILSRVLNQSNRFAQDLGEDVRDRVYQAIQVLANGFLNNDSNDCCPDDIDLIHDAALTYIYRLIFILYAESESRALLPIESNKYENDYSITALKQEVCEELGSDDPSYREYEFELWRHFEKLFRLIDKGSKPQNIPPEDFEIIAYNGGLFRTDPESYDSAAAHFLQENRVADTYLAEVVELLAKSDEQKTDDNEYADYSTLDVRHLGGIYEAILEYDLVIAPEPMATVNEDGTEIWRRQSEVTDDQETLTSVDEGEAYLKSGDNERKSFGSYYTPEYVVEYIVDDSLSPVLEDIRDDLKENHPPEEYAERFEQRVYELSILDPAMGSGHFLVGVINKLTTAIVSAEETQLNLLTETYDDEDLEAVAPEHKEESTVRRNVAQRCIYGVDVQPMAVELAKVSLWQTTLAAGKPLAFLDHHLTDGNSLVGSNIEEIDELPEAIDPDSVDEDVQAGLGSFGATHMEAVEDVRELHQQLVRIENSDRTDAKEMEQRYQEIREDPRVKHLNFICDVHTCEQLGYDIPTGVYQQMAQSIDDKDDWEELKENDWYQEVAAVRNKRNFLNWHLTFPQVFYEDQSAGEISGFDVVLGNPPYAPADHWADSYFDAKFEVAEYFTDLYPLFIEQGLSLLKDDGQFGYIIPEPWLTQQNSEELRSYVLTNSWIRTIIQFEERVFDERDVSVDTIIMMAQKTAEHEEVNAYHVDNSGGTIPELALRNSTDQQLLLENEDAGRPIEIRRTPEEQEALEQIRSASKQLQQNIGEVRIGIQAYNSTKHDDDVIESRAFHADTKLDDDYLPVLEGKNIDRYSLNYDSLEYLKVGDHLHDCPPRRFFTQPRILIQEITNESRNMINAVYETDEYCYYKSAHGVLATSEYDIRYLLGVINSEIMSWVFPRTSYKIISGLFPRMTNADAKELPIPEIEFSTPEYTRAMLTRVLLETYAHSLESGDATAVKRHIRGACMAGHSAVAHDAVAHFASRMQTYRKRRERLNLSLADYIEPFDTSSTLQEFAWPVPAIDETILVEKATDDARFKITDFKLVDQGGVDRLEVTVEYEKDEEEGTEKIEVFEFRSLTSPQRTVLEEYLPMVLEETEDGKYADFLPHATSTISLIERLRGLTLPVFSQVETGVEQYLEEKATDRCLERHINITDSLIDYAVSELYGLSSEQRAVIETGLAEQE